MGFIVRIKENAYWKKLAMFCWLKYLVHYLMDSLYALLISSWLYCFGLTVFNRIDFVVLSAIKKDKFHCLKWQLGLKIDDMDILRCYGRFLNATMAEVTKYPKLLPRREHLISLLITKVHQRLMYAGVAHILDSAGEGRG